MDGLSGKPVFDTPPGELDYPGETEAIPTFDEELAPEELPQLANALSTDVPPAGKGPSRGYETRHKMIAKLHARGFTNNQIGRHLGYSPAGVSLALKHPWVQAEAEKERRSLIDEDAPAILKAASVHAAKRIERTILDPESKNGDAMSQFVIEKNYGKAVQQVNHESNSLAAFMELLKQTGPGQPIDVTPTHDVAQLQSAEVPTDSVSDWLDANLT